MHGSGVLWTARGFYEDLFELEVCQDYGINFWALPAGLTGWWGCRRSRWEKRTLLWTED